MTDMYCVIGKKLAHTLSPEIHRAYFELSGRQGEYTAVELTEEEIARGREFLLGYDGVNVTIPYKQAVMPLLDGISDEAREIGAVNTIKREGGKLFGYNTDPYGFEAMLASRGIDPSGKSAYVLGYGGAARSVIYALNRLGADVTVVSRDPARAAADGHAAIDYEELRRREGYLLVNCTPMGMYPNADASPVGDDVVARFDAAADLIYNPVLTRFLRSAISLGKRAVGGLYMLVAQAMKSQHIWTGDDGAEALTKTVYDRIARGFLRDTGNIWLIGMPGCGKTTFGSWVAQKTEREFVDADAYVQHLSGMTIAEMFERGEDFFRDEESEAIACLACRKGLVIATGGGAVLRDFNIDCMRLSGTTVFIDRAPSDIIADVDYASRPLLVQGAERVWRLYGERKDRYAAAAQITIANDTDEREVFDRILSALGEK